MMKANIGVVIVTQIDKQFVKKGNKTSIKITRFYIPPLILRFNSDLRDRRSIFWD